jgi:hypothetical protein
MWVLVCLVSDKLGSNRVVKVCERVETGPDWF